MYYPTDIARLGEIPDPFALAADSPVRPMDTREMRASPTRSRIRTLRVIAAVGALFLEAGWLILIQHHADPGTLSPFSVALGVVISLAAALVALRAVTARGALGLGERPLRLAVLVGLALLLFLLGTRVAAPADLEGPAFWELAMRCMRVTAVMTASSLALGVWAFRRSFVAAAAWRTAALGVASGALAAATMSIACPNGGALHVIVGHGATMLAGGLIGAALGRSITRA